MSRYNMPKAAGLEPQLQRDSTADCLTFPRRQPTPEKVGYYRKSYFSEPGTRTAHPGLLQDLKQINPLTKFGLETTTSDHVPECLVSGPGTEYQRLNLAKIEANYLSHKREPLGKSYLRGYKLSVHMQRPEFAFGVTGTFSESAKELLYPSTSENLLNSQQNEEHYKRSHGSVAPGEQKNRKYQWKIDPGKHRFGIKPNNQDAGAVAIILNPEINEIASPPAVALEHLEDRRDLYDHLGRPRHLGAADTANLTSTHVFGITTQSSESAWQCIQGKYTPEEQQPDTDLGRPVSHGWQNATMDTRLYGIPTIRNDIPAPAQRSIADDQNYGDDANAQSLLYPEEYAFKGVRNAEFAAPRDRTYLKELVMKIGLSKSDDQFDCIWNRATQSKRYTPVGEVSIAEYRDALNDFLQESDRGSS